MKIRRFSQLPGRLPGGERLVDLVFTWNPARPHEVTAALQAAGYVSRRWVFDRDLLVDGLTGPAGLGTVTVLPDLFAKHSRRRVVLVLAAPEQSIALPIEVAELREFLDLTSVDGDGAAEAA